MRRSLPLPADLVAGTRPVDVHPFRSEDAEGLLRVNNRAFEWHPDQGGWSEEQLASRMSEPWFEATDLLVHHTEAGSANLARGDVDGFCWTKVHEPLTRDVPGGPRPATGEIFVIATDPDAHGSGLGQALTVAGLQHLTSKGLALAMLYVEADNLPAVRLYERLGMSVHHSDAGYSRA